MKKVVICFILLLSEVSYCQWEPFNNGLYYGKVNVFSEVNNTIIVGMNGGGILISTDCTKTWAQKTENLTSYVYSIYQSNDTIIIGSHGEGLFISTNKGNTWNQKVDRITFAEIYSILFYKNSLIIGTNKGIFASQNFGNSFNHVFDTNAVFKIFYQNDDTIFTCAGLFLYYSIDGGKKWNKSTSNLLPIFSSDKIILAKAKNEMYITSDKGKKWEKFNCPLDINKVAFVHFNENKVIVGNRNQLFYSNDYGLNWSNIYKKDFVNFSLTACIITNTNILIGSTIGLLISSDNGLSWEQYYPGVSYNISVNSITGHEKKLFAATQRGIYSYDHIEGIWQKISSLNKNALFSNEYLITVGDGKNIHITTDEGKTWLLRSEIYSGYNINVVYAKEKIIYAGTNKGLLKSTDLGISWTLITPEINPFNVIAIEITDYAIFVLTTTKLFKSTDNGKNWSELSPRYSLSRLRVKNNIVVLSAGYHSFIYVSLDSGDKFSNCEKFLLNSVTSIEIFGNLIFLGYSDQGVLLIRDYGKSWEYISDGLTDMKIKKLYIDGSYIYAGTANYGIFRAKLSFFGINNIEEESNINERNTYSITPNPAREYIEIAFSNPRLKPWVDDEDAIKIFNLLGECVLSAGGAGGTHPIVPYQEGKMRVDVSTLPPGVYFVRVGDWIGRFVKI